MAYLFRYKWPKRAPRTSCRRGPVSPSKPALSCQSKGFVACSASGKRDCAVTHSLVGRGLLAFVHSDDKLDFPTRPAATQYGARQRASSEVTALDGRLAFSLFHPFSGLICRTTLPARNSQTLFEGVFALR